VALKAPTLEHAVGWLETDGNPVQWANRTWEQVDGGSVFTYLRRGDEVERCLLVTRALNMDGRRVLRFTCESGPIGEKAWRTMVKLAMETEVECE